jgi:hypothetical protein
MSFSTKSCELREIALDLSIRCHLSLGMAKKKAPMSQVDLERVWQSAKVVEVYEG